MHIPKLSKSPKQATCHLLGHSAYASGKLWKVSGWCFCYTPKWQGERGFSTPRSPTETWSSYCHALHPVFSKDVFGVWGDKPWIVSSAQRPWWLGRYLFDSWSHQLCNSPCLASNQDYCFCCVSSQNWTYVLENCLSWSTRVEHMCVPMILQSQACSKYIKIAVGKLSFSDYTQLFNSAVAV